MYTTCVCTGWSSRSAVQARVLSEYEAGTGTRRYRSYTGTHYKLFMLQSIIVTYDL
jgi:hypothetical protein